MCPHNLEGLPVFEIKKSFYALDTEGQFVKFGQFVPMHKTPTADLFFLFLIKPLCKWSSHRCTSQYTLVHFGTLWYPLVPSSTTFYTLVHFGTSLYTLVHFGTP